MSAVVGSIHQDIVTSIRRERLVTIRGLLEFAAQLTLTREAGRILRVGVPFVLTLVDVAVTIRVYVCVGGVERIEAEVILPSSPHSIIVLILVIDLRAV